MIVKSKVDRRFFLQGLGASVFLPILSSIPGVARAATPKAKRFIAIFTANGQYSPSWYPQGTLNWQQVQKNLKAANLADCNPSISDILGSPFDALKQKLLILRGLDLINSDVRDHWPGKMLSGFGNQNERHVSIDQIMARSASVYQTEPVTRSLNLVVPGPSDLGLPYSVSCSQVGGVAQAVNPQADPLGVFRQLFGYSTPANRGSLIDRVKSQYDALRTSSYLSNFDKSRLDAHITFIGDLHRRLETPRPTCDAVSKPDPIGTKDIDYQTVTRNHIDLLVAAIKCDFTRVGVLQMGGAADSRKFTFIPECKEGADGSGTTNFHGYHAITHDPISQAATKVLAISKWQSSQVADLLNKLNVVEEPDTGRTYLDNSIVYWGNELGVWGDPDAVNSHMSLDFPVLLAGDCRGFFTPGRILDYRSDVRKASPSYPNGGGTAVSYLGRPVNELLITLMMAMGLSPTEWEQGSDPGFGDYSGNYNNQYEVGDRRSALPSIKV